MAGVESPRTLEARSSQICSGSLERYVGNPMTATSSEEKATMPSLMEGDVKSTTDIGTPRDAEADSAAATVSLRVLPVAL